jgi:hypothetical protein
LRCRAALDAPRGAAQELLRTREGSALYDAATDQARCAALHAVLRASAGCQRSFAS